MYRAGIIKSIEVGHRNEIISRKIYLVYPTQVFIGNEEQEFAIFNAISNEFKVPITSVQVVGSSKTGRSYFKGTDFAPGESDLDIAIIDPILYQRYCEIVMRETDGFRNLANFTRMEETDHYQSYLEYLVKGIFRPDFMPACEARKNWFNFFNKLSQRYIELFSGINAGIYFSQVFFEYKQSNTIDHFKMREL